MSARWFRDIYRDAVWESPSLKAAEKAVAETYARHARDRNDSKGPDADLAWLTYPRLMELAGLGRRAAVSAALATLVQDGWLVVEREVPRRPTLYRLTIPSSGIGTTDAPAEVDDAGSSSGGTTAELEAGAWADAASSDGGTSVVPLSEGGSSDGGTTVVPLTPIGSSDGGTQPLGPSVSSSSPLARERATGALAGADDDDEEQTEEQTRPAVPMSPRRRLMALVGAATPSVTPRPHVRRTTDAPSCGHPGCKAGGLIFADDDPLGVVDGNPLGVARCPRCTILDGVNTAA